jgi:flavin-dependent dehydrogenase
LKNGFEGKKMYDIIVIGAGPTGSTAAKTLSDKGYKVLVVEKFDMPRYKSCSGILIKKSIDLVNLYFGETVPISSMCAPTENKGMIFTDDKGKEYRFEQPGLNVWRSTFDNWLAMKAKESGAEIRDCTVALSCEEEIDFVTVTLRGKQSYTEKARYILDCEGVVGAFKRKIIKDTSGFITTFQTFNEGTIDLDSSYFYAYLQPELSEYDAWFNVKDNLLVFGVAVKDIKRIDYFYSRFLDYMKNYHHLRIDKQIKTEKWLMPHIKPGCDIDYGVGRVLFAGEIAGFLNPMGEGISAGMESGYCAACAIANSFDELESIYADYRHRTKGLKHYMERQWNFVANMADTFMEMKL